MAKETSVFEGLPSNIPEPPKPDSGLPAELEGKNEKEIYDILKQEHERIVGELEANRGVPAQTPTPPVQPTPQFRPSPPEIPDPSYDPQGYARFISEQTEQRLRPVVETTLNSLKEIGRNTLAQQHPEEYNEFKDEVEAFMTTLSPQVQADPRSWNTALRFVKSLHEEEITDKKAKKLAKEMLKEMGHEMPEEAPPKQSLFRNNVAPVTTMPRQSGANQRRSRLTEAEQKARKFLAPGMSDEEYMKYRELNNDMISAQEKGL